MNDTSNSKVTLILPVRKAGGQVRRCLRSVFAGTLVPEIFLMDCTAVPGALDPLRREFPNVRIFEFGMNPGRAHAVNTGIHLTRTPYVMTLSPRLLVGKHCIERLCEALDRDGMLLCAQAGILSGEDPSRIRGAGWSLGPGMEPFVRGEGAKASSYSRRAKIIAAQMDAAVYRMEYLEVTGILDERYYGWLEDLDLGFRGSICGFSSLYEPGAICKEMETRERNLFYRQLETGNTVYFRYKFGMNSPLTGFAEHLGERLRDQLGDREQNAEYRTAVERGRMLSFQAEMERMERDELAMSVTKQTLPEEVCLRVNKDGPAGVYPLYLGERADFSCRDLPWLLRVYAAMMAGTGGKILKLFHSDKEI